MCAFINLSGISPDQILNSLLIEYKDNVQGLLFIIPMLITVEQLIKQTTVLLYETKYQPPLPSNIYYFVHQFKWIFHVESFFPLVTA